MIDHTIEEIEKMRKYCDANSYSKITKTFRHRTIEYYTLPPETNPDLPGFIARASNHATKTYVIAISVAVPDAIQSYYALAEYIEFVEQGITTPGRVIAAEKEVLAIIPKALIPCYCKHKSALFQEELLLSKQQPEKYALDESDVQEFKNAIIFLKKYIPADHS